MRLLEQLLSARAVRVLAMLLFTVSAPPAVAAGRYSARRIGDVVRLEDTAGQTVVSIVPSVGNITFEMTVKGQNVLRWPYASLEAFKARPGLSGIPFLGPWANRLDEQAFFANGKRYAFDMELGNIRGDSHPRFPDHNGSMADGRSQGRR